MSTKELLVKVADLLLKSEDSTKDWVCVKTLRRTWYVFCAGMLMLVLENVFMSLNHYLLTTSAQATLILRIFTPRRAGNDSVDFLLSDFSLLPVRAFKETLKFASRTF